MAAALPRTKSFILVAAVWAIFVVLIGLRHHVGMDWSNYTAIHQSLSGANLERVLQGGEYGSRYLMWLSANHLDGMVSSNLVASIVLVSGVIAVALRSREPWLALLAATPYLLIVIGMSGLRQSIAIGLFFLSVANWDRMSLITRIALIVGASLFHTSAIFMLAFAFLSLDLRPIWKGLVIAVFAPLAVYYAQQAPTLATSFSAYAENYLSVDGRVDSPGALGHVALVALPAAIYLLWRTRMEQAVHHPSLMRYAAWACVLLVPLALLYSTAASRISLYFQFVPMLVAPALVHALGGATAKLAARGAIALGYVLYLGAWLTAANSAHAYLPYANYLWLD